jgi:nitrogen fixation NifU-like protein
LAQPDGYGRRTGDCKDTVEIFLLVQDDVIYHAAFETDGCIDTHACANSVVHLVEGKSLEQAWQITPDTVEQLLETLSENHKHCAQLAVGALYLALSNALEVARHPWKKLYKQH